MEPAPPELVRHTLEKLADDFDISAVRLGMLGSAAVAEAVADVLEDRNLPHVVLDPILRSSSGAALIDAEGLAVLRKRLLRLAEVVTPNIDEAAELADIGPLHPSTHWEEALAWMIRAADKLHSRGVRNVVITGGHLAQPNDLLSQKVGNVTTTAVYPGAKIQSSSTHGTGCAFATAIACRLAQASDFPELSKGQEVAWAVQEAKAFVQLAIQSAYPLGKGTGPIHHLAPFKK